ncbi:MAG: BNR-4 repeat-containing protein [Candidatus Zixiibacteriota bacterium]
MATETLYVSGAGDLAQGSIDEITFTENYEYVQSEDGAVVYTIGISYVYDAHALNNRAANYGTINSVMVHIICAKVGTSTNNQVAPILRLGGTNEIGTNFAITTSMAEYSQVVARPGGGSWTASDIDSLQAGYRLRARGLGGEQPQVDYMWVVVDYEPGNHPAPTNLECERATNPTDASEDPVFSAIFNASGGSGTATHAYIQVSTVSDFASTVWDSGWIDIADIAHGVRCALIDYNGSGLSSDPPDASDWYYWRIKFKDASATESSYSSAAQFKVTQRAWWNRSYAFRQKILLNSSHGDLPDDTTLRFNFKTGNRVKIATNAAFNEGIQEAGYMIAEFGERAHIVYLSETGTDAQLGIYIQSYDKNTKTWGTPYRIDDAKTGYDTHNYPTLCIDNNGYLHVFYGCHGSPCYYRRSTLPNQSGAFAGDGGGGAVWTSAQTIGSKLTYPQAFVVPSTNRIVLIMRSSHWNGSSWRDTKVSMFYSTDGGASWSSERAIVFYTEALNYRVYCYGVRFDPKIERVHLGFSFVVSSPLNMTKGVWYAYADFDSGNADGFAAWKTINGTACGTTESAPISMATAGSVRLNDTGDINIFFCRNVALTNTGEPLVFWATAPWYLDAWGQDSAFGMSHWNGSAWVHSNITEDYDIMMRTDRAGLPTLTDSDGVIHTFTAVDSVVDKHHRPSANGFHTNVLVIGAASLYETVDDGISFYDADDSYVGATSTGEASVTSSDTLPSGVAILSVGVELVIRDLTGGASFTPFVRISGTDYAATAITGISTGAGYVVKRAWWNLNPATSASWLKAAAEGVEFGVKQTVAAKTWRCTRINRLVKVRHATNEDNYASEVAELTSNDLGGTWSLKRLTDNSALGVPILSIKHNYTNRQIELVWVSGSDLFYLDAKGYGRMRPDAHDLRLIWQGNGSFTELHRIIDYANLDNTLVEFKIPEAIGSAKVAGSKDLFAYSGNPEVADDPLSDPAEVYPLMFENFESLADGTDIDGQLGWTVNSGTGIIYASPPNHNNKVYAGANSLKATGTFEAEKTFSPTLADVAIDAAIWIEVGARSYLQAVDASAAVFSVGINNSTDYACYEDGSGWHDHATVRAAGQNMCAVRLVVNAAGCSAWVNGQQICSNVTAITSITKIKLGSASESYFDRIKISRWYATNPVLELQAEEVAGFTLDMALLGAGIEQFTIDAKLDKFFTRSSVVAPVEAKLGIQAQAQIPAESKAMMQSSSRLSCEFSSSFSATLKAHVESLLRYAARQQLPVESTVATASSSVLPAEFLSTLAVQQKIFADWALSLRITSPLPVESLAALEIRSLLPAEYKGTTAIAMALPVEYLQALAAVSAQPAEYLQVLLSSGAPAVEFSGRTIAAFQLPVESKSSVAVLLVTPVEWMAGLLAAIKSPVEFNQMVSSGAIIPVESLRNVAQSVSVPVEWTGTVEVSTSAKLPVEFTGSLQVSAPLPVEANGQVSGSSRMPLEFSGTLAIKSAIALEWLSRTAAISRLEVESLQVISSAGSAFIEILTQQFSGALLPTEFAATLKAAGQLAVEWLGGQSFSVSAQIPVEWRAGIDARGRMEVESLSVRTIGALLPAEFNREVESTQRLPLEFASALAGVIGNMSVEFGRRFSEQYSFPIDFGRLSSATLTAAIEYSTGVLARADLPVEFAGSVGFSTSQAMPVEWRAAIATSLTMPVESRATIEVVGGRLMIESGRAFAASNSFAVEYGQQLVTAQRLIADWLGAIGASGRMSIDYVSPVAGTLTTVIEFNRKVSVESRLNVEHLRAILSSAKIPVEYIGVFLAVLAIANASVRSTELGGALVRTPELTGAVARVIELFATQIRRQ